MTQYTDIVLTVITAIVIPTAIAVIRLAIKWTRMEDRILDVASDVEKLMRDKDRTHTEIVTRMNTMVDRLDNRIRYLEERRWKDGGSGGGQRRGYPPNNNPPVQYHRDDGNNMDDAGSQ